MENGKARVLRADRQTVTLRDSKKRPFCSCMHVGAGGRDDRGSPDSPDDRPVRLAGLVAVPE